MLFITVMTPKRQFQKFLSRQDAAFNKTTRSLQELQQKELGVKPEFRSVPRRSGFETQTSVRRQIWFC